MIKPFFSVVRLPKKEIPTVNRLVRRGRQFFLIEEPSRLGEAVREIRCTLRQVFEWQQNVARADWAVEIESP